MSKSMIKPSKRIVNYVSDVYKNKPFPIELKPILVFIKTYI